MCATVRSTDHNLYMCTKVANRQPQTSHDRVISLTNQTVGPTVNVVRAVYIFLAG